MELTLEDRAKLYNKAFPNYPEINFSKGHIVGSWMIGNFYRNKTRFYGAYPHSYLKRIMSMFPDLKMVMHLFSGSLTSDDVKGIRVDIDPKLDPDYVVDAHKLSSFFSESVFDGIFADPDYSVEDANHRGIPMINRNKVVKECVKVLQLGGFLVWLDQVYPMYRKPKPEQGKEIGLKLVGEIGLIRSTNHRVREVFIFQKVKEE